MMGEIDWIVFLIVAAAIVASALLMSWQWALINEEERRLDARFDELKARIEALEGGAR